MSTPAFTLPTAKAIFTIEGSPILFVDLNTVWLSQVDGVAAALVADLAANATTIHVTQLSPTLAPINPAAIQTSAGIANTATRTAKIAVDCVIVIDSEPMTVTAISGTAIDGYDLTVARGAEQTNSAGLLTQYILAVPAIHKAGAPISVLTYPSAGLWIGTTAILPKVMDAVKSLGTASAAYAFSTSLTIQLPS